MPTYSRPDFSNIFFGIEMYLMLLNVIIFDSYANGYQKIGKSKFVTYLLLHIWIKINNIGVSGTVRHEV